MCEHNYMRPNISKRKELVIDFKRRKDGLLPIIINNQQI